MKLVLFDQLAHRLSFYERLVGEDDQCRSCVFRQCLQATLQRRSHALFEALVYNDLQLFGFQLLLNRLAPEPRPRLFARWR